MTIRRKVDLSPAPALALAKPSKADRKPVSIDTSGFKHPKPQHKAQAMAQQSREYQKQREASAELRRRVFARDNGVCSNCDLDTEALAAQWIKDLKADLSQYTCNICGLETPSVPCIHCGAKTCSQSFQHRTAFREMLAQLGFPKDFSRKYNGVTLWQADHATPVHEGGVGLGLSNARTLCLICHGEVNAHQAQTRALRRRHAR